MLKQKGQGLVEYGLILTLISLISVGAMSLTGTTIKDVYCGISEKLSGDKNCQSYYFFDDFEGDLSNWNVVHGTWDIIDGKLHTKSAGEGQIFTDIDQKEYEVELGDVNLKSGDGFGVVFKAEDTEAFNGYTFQYDPGYAGGSFIFRKWANGHEFAPFARNDVSDFDWYNTDHDIKVSVNGGQYTAYVDDQIVCQGYDDTWIDNTKSVGLRTWSTTDVTFDSFSVNPVQGE